MSRTFRILLVVALLFGVVAAMHPQVAQAQDTKFPAYISGIQVANLDAANAASVSLTAYNPDGTQNGSPLSASIPVNSSRTFFPISNVSAGFSGSIVISSNRNVAAISNILSSNFAASASYVGRSGGSTTVLLPLLNKNNSGSTTWFSVQNGGGADANITVTYKGSTAPAVNATIKPGAARVFYQNSEPHNVPNFSATITSNQPIVAAVIQETSTVMYAYTGFAAGTTNPVFPLINANNNGTLTGVQIQNGGTQSTNVTVSYTPATAGAACTETQTIPAGEAKTFAFLAFFNTQAGENCADKAKFVGSARVTTNSANQPLVGIVNQLTPTQAGAYNAFSDADAGATVVLPLIMDRNGGTFTGIQVQNVGAAAVKIRCTFTKAGEATPASHVAEAVVQPNAALNDLQFNKLGQTWVGSATCSGLNPSTNAADPSARLVAVVNQLGASTADTLMVYEGIKR